MGDIDKVNKHIKPYGFFILWWVLGLILACIWGLGWFFLIETLRRVITFYPPTRDRLKRLFDVSGEIKPVSLTLSNQRKSQIMELIIILAWIGMTIFVFDRANISLLMIIKFLRSV